MGNKIQLVKLEPEKNRKEKTPGKLPDMLKMLSNYSLAVARNKSSVKIKKSGFFCKIFHHLVFVYFSGRVSTFSTLAAFGPRATQEING